jgi:hypothetical protein
MLARTLFPAIALVFLCQGTTVAQIITIDKAGGKTVACMHAGLTSTGHQAGMAVDINGTSSSFFPTITNAMQAQPRIDGWCNTFQI